MEIETSARLFALEILMANLIAERPRTAADPVEASGKALKMILDQIAALPLSGPDAGMHNVIRTQIGEAAAAVMKMALDRVKDLSG
jgi:hypothetical protein